MMFCIYFVGLYVTKFEILISHLIL